MGVVIWISGDHSIETTKNTSVVVFPQQTVCPENLGESKQFEVSSQNINNHGAEKLLFNMAQTSKSHDLRVWPFLRKYLLFFP